MGSLTVATFFNGPTRISAQCKESPTSFVHGDLSLWNLKNTIRSVIVFSKENTNHLPIEAIASMKVGIALSFSRLLRVPLFIEKGSRELYTLKDNGEKANPRYSRQPWGEV